MKQQKIINNQKKTKAPIVIDERKNNSSENSSDNKIPIRAVVYVEVGDMDKIRTQCLVQELNKVYGNARGGVHYIIPVRNGRIRTDIIFESEILDVVRQICEVKDGQIVLKNEQIETNVFREFIK